MCNKACKNFIASNISKEDIQNKDVLELGSRDVNGSLRTSLEEMDPKTYIGTDIIMGGFVDEICPAEETLERFGAEKFDLVFSTELMEHVHDWRTVIHNKKHLLRPGGLLFITTRSKGYGYHAWPADFWRYELDDMRAIFSDFDIEILESDPLSPGVFIKARKPLNYTENSDLDAISLYSIVTKKRAHHLRTIDLILFKAVHIPRRMLSLILPEQIKKIVRKKRFAT